MYTTFELVDGLWLTDSTYANIALADSQGKHPEFLGPNMWHFHKDQKIYRQFAAELVMQGSALWGIDHAIPNGLCDILLGLEKVCCTQHMMERDAYKILTKTRK